MILDALNENTTAHLRLYEWQILIIMHSRCATARVIQWYKFMQQQHWIMVAVQYMCKGPEGCTGEKQQQNKWTVFSVFSGVILDAA